MKPYRVEFKQGGEDAIWNLRAVRRNGVVRVHHSRQKSLLYSTEHMDSAHDHPTDQGGTPVVVVDLHGTLTPTRGYPMAAPYPGTKEALDQLSAAGCCIHLATAALSPYHADEILEARQQMTWAWIKQYALPISIVEGKVGAHVYVDDRMVTADGDWDRMLADILNQLEQRAELKDGKWSLVELPDVGEPVEDWPNPDEVLPDQPRGFSTPVVDIDLHRCALKANSSTFDAGPNPDSQEAINSLYDANYTIHLSCAGWDPATHAWQESQERNANLRLQVRRAGIKYDSLVSKDHPTVSVDDKGIPFTTWAETLPLVAARLTQPDPEDEVTGIADTPEIPVAIPG